LVEWETLLSHEPRIPGGGWVEQPLVLVVGLVAGEQPGGVPVLDRGGVNPETVGGFGDREQAAVAEPVEPSWGGWRLLALDNKDGAMSSERSVGKPTTRRYSMEEKQAAVRMVGSLRAETGTTAGTVRRVAEQLGYGVESVRSWVKQSEVDDGVRPGVSTVEAERVKDLEQEVRELRRANEILRRAATFFGAELDRQQRR
jgi:transposase